MFGKTIYLATGVALTIVSSILATYAVGQGNAKAKTQGTKPTLGTVQMPGDNGKFGTIYQLGNKGSELQFTLTGAEVAMRYKTVQQNIIAGKNERLLVLNFTVQNPVKKEQEASSSAFKVTVVSPDDQNVEYRGSFYEPDKRTNISQLLKPAQKVKLTAVIPIFAQGPITKIIVARGSGPVLRYDLREGLAKSKSVFSPDGVSIEDNANAELGKPFDLDGFDIEIQEVKELSEAVGGYVPSATQGVYVAVVKFSNPLAQRLSVGWQYFLPTLTDENGEKIHWAGDMFSMSSASAFSQDVDGDGSVRARYMFSGAKGLKLAKFKLTDNGSGRSVSIKLP